MSLKEVYNIWAPFGSRWIDWVRPVPFVSTNTSYVIREWIDYTIPTICYMRDYCKDMAIIIDLPAVNSIKEGIALTSFGYRPIPIFNGTNPMPNTKATTNNLLIGPLLIWGASKLHDLSLKADANPVFLLDKNRLQRYKIDPSVFDNSWDVYSQDLPSAEYFLQHGIHKILVRSDRVERDLGKILYQFQKRNIQILFTNGYEEAKKIKIKKIREK